jgi:hypothetical protein
LAPQAELGQVRRPDNGASSEPSSGDDGNKLGRIHVSGCKKMCAQSIFVWDLALFFPNS